jgi:YHS domain-containing protein
MASRSIAADEQGQLKTYHFCSKEHLAQFARKRGIELEKY